MYGGSCGMEAEPRLCDLVVEVEPLGHRVDVPRLADGPEDGSEDEPAVGPEDGSAVGPADGPADGSEGSSRSIVQSNCKINDASTGSYTRVPRS